MQYNGLTRLADDLLTPLTRLCVLRLHDNALETLASLPAAGAPLVELDASRNRLTACPVLHGFPCLRRLALAENALSELPWWDTDACPALTELDLTRNRLHVLPNCFESLPALAVLRVAHNRLPHLPPSLAQCTRLQVLDASGNVLVQRPEWLAAVPEVNLDGNPDLLAA